MQSTSSHSAFSIAWRAATFVFLDIETTGLPSKNFDRPNITQLAMFAILRNELTATVCNQGRRLLGKWTMNYNPVIRIDPFASQLTGLTNQMLANYTTFNRDAASTILSYVSQYPKPVCLIAHNGNAFDFRIIKRSFDDAGVTFPNYVFCADSLKIFRELDQLGAKLLLEELTDGGGSNTSPEEPRKSFKLTDIYQRVFGAEKANLHTAEFDVEALYEIAVAFGSSFVEIAEKNAVPFSSIQGKNSARTTKYLKK